MTKKPPSSKLTQAEQDNLKRLSTVFDQTDGIDSRLLADGGLVDFDEGDGSERPTIKYVHVEGHTIEETAVIVLQMMEELGANAEVYFPDDGFEMLIDYDDNMDVEDFMGSYEDALEILAEIREEQKNKANKKENNKVNGTKNVTPPAAKKPSKKAAFNKPAKKTAKKSGAAKKTPKKPATPKTPATAGKKPAAAKRKPRGPKPPGRK